MKFSLATLALGISSVSATNFIVIQPDDMAFYESWNPPAYKPWGNSYPGESYPRDINGVTTPLKWLDKLRTDGMVMTQAYAAAPKCGTSRYSTVTGRYPTRSSTARKQAAKNNVDPIEADIPSTKLTDQGFVQDGDDCSRSNIAQVFKKNGYKTGVVGKWHLSKTGDKSVAEISNEVEGCGFSSVGALYPDNLTGQPWSVGIEHNMEYVAHKAVEFIKAHQTEDWFLYVNPTVPHSPDMIDAMLTDCRVTPDGDLTSQFPSGGFNVPEMDAKFGGDCHAYRQDIINNRAGASLNRGNRNDELGAIWVDDAIGAIYQTLVSTQQLDDTFILFQLDHGRVDKDKIWENGIRIPQFIHWPAGQLPSSFDGLVSTIDIGPTILDIAGITSNPMVPESLYNMDGKSWKASVMPNETPLEDFSTRCLFFESNLERAVRCGCHKYMHITAASTEMADVINLSPSYVGWTTGADSNVLIDLCDASGNYITVDNFNTAIQSPEVTNVIDDVNYANEKTVLENMLACHMSKTYAVDADTRTPDYSECTSGAAVTERPTQSPTTSATYQGTLPLLVDIDPLKETLLSLGQTTFSATVQDDNIRKVKFKLQKPNGDTVPSGGGMTDGTFARTTAEGDVYETSFTLDVPGKYGYKITISDRSGNSVSYPEDGGFYEFVVATEIGDLIEAARADINAMWAKTGGHNMKAKFIRHGFHDCVGGCDGCVDMSNPDNAGLEIPIAALAPVVEMYEHDGLGFTRADIWVLAALEASNAAQELNHPGNREWHMDYYGRKNCEVIDPTLPCASTPGACATSGPDRTLPSTNFHAHELLTYFETEFDYDAQETVAILGAHTMGGMFRENSGYDGEMGWVAGPMNLNNEYYADLLGDCAGDAVCEATRDESGILFKNAPNFTMVEVDNSDVAADNKFQWERSAAGNTMSFTMLNSDISLVRDLSSYMDAATGEVTGCTFRCKGQCRNGNRCPISQSDFFDQVVDYKLDNDLWLEDFELAFKKMLNRGYSPPACATSPSSPCDIQGVAVSRNLRGKED